MRPLAVLNAIVFGSAAAITFGLSAVVVIFLILRGVIRSCASEFPVAAAQQRPVCRADDRLRREPLGCSKACAGAGWRRRRCGSRSRA